MILTIFKMGDENCYQHQHQRCHEKSAIASNEIKNGDEKSAIEFNEIKKVYISF